MGILVAEFGLKKKEPGAPPPRSVLQEGSETLGAYEQLYPRNLALQQKAAGDYAGLTADVLEQYGPRVSAAMARTRSPESQALYSELNQQAGQELAAGSRLTPSMQRELEQYVRAGAAARGFGYGPSDLTDEVMTLGSAGEDLKARRRAFAESVLGFDTGTDQAALQTVLGRTPSTPAYNTFDPYAADVYNTNFNAAWTNKLATRNYNAAMLAAGINFDAQVVGSASKAAACWVAREVFGHRSALWRLFQGWLFEDAPAWFRWAYLRWGWPVADWLHDKPRLKRLVRHWMIGRIWNRMERRREFRYPIYDLRAVPGAPACRRVNPISQIANG